MAPSDWKLRLERFFYERGRAIDGVPTLYDHCIVSAKDPRVSARPEVHEDVIASILRALRLSSNSRILEVGCASGYIACGLARHVAQYTGVDLAASPLEVARKMNLPNARFIKGDGAALPFESGEFDVAFAYDVFTNFPDFEDGAPLIREMLRVVKPGGLVMVGSVTDKKKSSDFEARARQVADQLLVEKGPQPTPAVNQSNFFSHLFQTLFRNDRPPDVPPEIVVYYYDLDGFRKLAQAEGVAIDISDVHRLNPYLGFRYNVVLEKPAQ
jgi:ubiquinone/menaquinone biosynthesis C-methylase UbiE